MPHQSNESTDSSITVTIETSTHIERVSSPPTSTTTTHTSCAVAESETSSTPVRALATSKDPDPSGLPTYYAARSPLYPQSFYPPYPSTPSLSPASSSTTIVVGDASSTPPPTYSEVPRTRAERLFYWGFLPPFIGWILGMRHIWVPENPEEKWLASIEAQIGGQGGNVKECVKGYREEEVLWARRCAWCLAGTCIIGTMAIVVLISMLAQTK